eukprot:scaffold1303_cov221-Pinguiococcus_pyrenoidosus.AAC.1
MTTPFASRREAQTLWLLILAPCLGDRFLGRISSRTNDHSAASWVQSTVSGAAGQVEASWPMGGSVAPS